MQTKYTAARAVMGFIGVVGWVVFFAGIIIVLMVMSNELQMGSIGVGAGIAASIGGLIQVAIAQVSVAILDMADNSREMLVLQRAIGKNEGVPHPASPTPGPDASANEQVPSPPAEERKSDPRPAGQPPEERKAAPQVARQPLEGRESFETYMGEEIDYKDNRHHWNGQKFLTLGKAKAAIKSAKENSA